MMLNSKLVFELSKLRDMPVVMLTNPEQNRDNYISVIAIDRHRETRVVLADCLLILAAEYGQTVEQLMTDDYIELVYVDYKNA